MRKDKLPLRVLEIAVYRANALAKAYCKFDIVFCHLDRKSLSVIRKVPVCPSHADAKAFPEIWILVGAKLVLEEGIIAPDAGAEASGNLG